MSDPNLTIGRELQYHVVKHFVICGGERMEHGQLIRKLRRERNMSQAQLASGISSRTALSSFENSHSSITSDILFKYLERLNVTVQEYYFYLNDSVTPEKEYLAAYYYHEIIKKRDAEVAGRIRDFRAKYADSHDFFFCCMSIELKLFLNKKNAHNVYDVDEDKDIIKDYLNRVQNWGHFEISLFANCLNIFSSDYIRGTFTVLLKRTKLLSAIAAYQNDLSIFLNNCIALAFERHNLADVRYYVGELVSTSASSPRKAFDRMMCQFYVGLLQELTDAHGDSQNVIDQFAQLGFADHAHQLRMFRQRVLDPTEAVHNE
jgi:Rgg/GadR/MutR family transcriptional activator